MIRRIYYYNECCIRKGEVAGELTMSAERFDLFDNYPYEQQRDFAGFALDDCSYVEGETPEAILETISIWQQLEDPFHKKVYRNIKQSLQDEFDEKLEEAWRTSDKQGGYDDY